jgi:hypothetical protein
MYSLAYAYASQDRYGEAANLLVHVFTAKERILGFSHPDTQNAVKLLALVYEKLGQLDDANMLKQRISLSSS